MRTLDKYLFSYMMFILINKCLTNFGLSMGVEEEEHIALRAG